MSTGILTAPRSGRQLLSVGQAADLAGVSVGTIRNYCDDGQLEAVVSPSGYRKVRLESLCDAFGITLPQESEDTDETADDESGRCVVLFCRVSGKKQRAAGDLDRQVEDCQRFAKLHYPTQRVKVLKGDGSGLNDSRPEFLALVDMIVARKVSVIVCTYRERIARFGLNVIQHLAKANGVTIVETGGEDEEKKERSLQQDMIESCMAVMHCFSAKMNGIRGGARTKTVYPEGFKELVCQLAGSGLSKRAITAKIEKRDFRCLNTGKKLAERAVRNILSEIKQTAPIVPVSVRTFLKTRCNVQAGKTETTANLYGAFVETCELKGFTVLTRDKFTAFLKQTVRGLSIENGKVSVASGICLRQMKG